jgi:ribosomal-protein-alanine N-acetyltransferase
VKEKSLKLLLAENQIVETPRLTLRTFRLDDAQDLLKMWSNPKVISLIGFRVRTDIIEMQELLATDYVGDPLGRYVIELKETGEAIGLIEIIGMNNDVKKADLMYALQEEFWGRGIMTEAAQAIVDLGFEKLGFKHMRIGYIKGNEASAKIAKNVGMKHHCIIKDGDKYNNEEFVDLYWSILYRDEWLKSRINF